MSTTDAILLSIIFLNSLQIHNAYILFYKSSENGVQNILCIQCIYFSYESKFLGHSQPVNHFI